MNLPVNMKGNEDQLKSVNTGKKNVHAEFMEIQVLKTCRYFKFCEIRIFSLT